MMDSSEKEDVVISIMDGEIDDIGDDDELREVDDFGGNSSDF